MNKIAIMLPGFSDLTEVEPIFKEEYEACLKFDVFEPVLYNEADLVIGEPLSVSKAASCKKQYFIIRCLKRPTLNSNILLHAFKRFGYYPAFGSSYDFNREGEMYWYPKPIDDLLPKRQQPYHRHIQHRTGEYAWWPDAWTYTELLPLIAKDHEGILTDRSGRSIILFDKPITDDTIDDVVRYFTNEDLNSFTNTYRKAPFWFEKLVDIAEYNNTPIEWRMFTFEEKLLYLCPKPFESKAQSIPAPPPELIASLCGPEFRYIDLALTTDNRWVALKEGPGEIAFIPEGGSVDGFYRSLASAVIEDIKLPSWIWCPVGYICDKHTLGENKTLVKGSRHFAAGTKVYITNSFFGDGAERCTVVGVPKYSKSITGVVIDTSLMEHFELERVTDPEIIKAMCTSRLKERFNQPRKTSLYTCWGQSEADKEEILSFVSALNDYHSQSCS